MTHTTVRWAEFRAAEPEFADVVRARFRAFQHHVLATIRPDGSPRLTGLEGDFRGDELWLGMMIGSRKALDLRRDPRFAMYANPGTGTGMGGGDVRVSGRAVEVTDPEEFARYARGADADRDTDENGGGDESGDSGDASASGSGEVPEVPERFHLFRAELSEVVRITVEDPHIVFQVWHPGHALRTIRRANEDSTVLEDL